MEATDRNFEAVRAILEGLNGYTVKEAEEILAYAVRTVRNSSTVRREDVSRFLMCAQSV